MAKQITIISGKGGTGKTTFSAGLAYLANGKTVLADADVDAPDLHLLLNPDKKSEEELNISKKVKRIESSCTKCGICEESCRYGAITTETINYFKCEGCGLCTRLCPENALELKEIFSAKLFKSNTRFGPFVHVEMAIGEGTSGRIVSAVRKQAQKIADEESLEYIIVDGSPGIGCPVIASITGADLAVIIIEPTLSGLHDLERVIGITDHFNVKPIVCINKYDINIKNSDEIISYCNKNNIQAIGKIPFDDIVPKSIVQNKTIFEVKENVVAEEIRNIWNYIQEILS
jgi:MinD superfamily P-loop ATPase